MQQSIVKFYCFVVQTLLNMFRALLCPSTGASQTAVAASGFRMNVEVDVFSAVVGLLDLVRGNLSVCCNQFLLYSCILSRNNLLIKCKSKRKKKNIRSVKLYTF